MFQIIEQKFSNDQSSIQKYVEISQNNDNECPRLIKLRQMEVYFAYNGFPEYSFVSNFVIARMREIQFGTWRIGDQNLRKCIELYKVVREKKDHIPNLLREFDIQKICEYIHTMAYGLLARYYIADNAKEFGDADGVEMYIRFLHLRLNRKFVQRMDVLLYEFMAIVLKCLETNRYLQSRHLLNVALELIQRHNITERHIWEYLFLTEAVHYCAVIRTSMIKIDLLKTNKKISSLTFQQQQLFSVPNDCLFLTQKPFKMELGLPIKLCNNEHEVNDLIEKLIMVSEDIKELPAKAIMESLITYVNGDEIVGWESDLSDEIEIV